MPTYQYRCKECGHDLEVVQSFHDDPLDTCPECEGALKKVYGNVGISFKGSGFYKTDSRGKTTSTKKADTKAETSSTDAGSSSTTTKSESSSSSDKKSSTATTSTSGSSSSD